uniref:tetraacyldisaccharide 4'-kinase n=1 Tax=Pararhizobium sp. IMCC3301 TaxID=3067904 RepID=UPI0027421E26|nr:tetraacyldisaccharide 4'-kinase [Pararhizobium sp. IMCC3301]
MLAPLGWIYGSVTAWRMKRRPRGKADRPVLCVGNLVLGGAGKTPTTLALARELGARGYKTGFLLRGFGGEQKKPLLVNAGHSASQVGDEALLYAEAGPTVVAADRVAGAALLSKAGVDVILMDDGFQNPALHKDMSVVVIDSDTAWGNGMCFPAGPLRAPVDRQLRQASAVVVLGDGARLDAISTVAQRNHVELFHGHIISRKLPDGTGGSRLLAYSGIGRPDKFFASLSDTGRLVVKTLPFPDHHLYTEADAEKILSRCYSLNAVPITTEKDHARLRHAPKDSYRAELCRVSLVLKISVDLSQAEGISRMLQDLMQEAALDPASE